MGTMTVSLYKDNNLKSNTKYRNGGLNNATPIVTLTTVSNGAISNKNVFADNSVEISTPIETAATANYITLTIGTTCIAGEVTGMDYINDDNTNVQYAIDYFTTAQMTQALRGEFFTGVFGHCERTNLTYPGESVVNQQPEPFVGNDYSEPHPEFTAMLNEAIQTFTGVTSANGIPLQSRGYAMVLWISAFAAQACSYNGGVISNVDGWQVNPAPPTSDIHMSTDGFNSIYRANAMWAGGFKVGYPVVFTGYNAPKTMTDFVNGMLNNVGIQVEYGPEGLQADATMRRFVTRTDEQFFFPEPNDVKDYTTPMTQVRLIGANDLLGVDIVPEEFCDAGDYVLYGDYTLPLGLDLTNFNPLIDEKTVILPDGSVVYDYSKSKLMTYPYWYFTVATAVGDKITIKPQTHMSISNYINTFNIHFVFKFTGGTDPCLQVAVLSASEIENGVNPYMTEFSGEWHTIYNYPTIAWGSSVSAEQKLQGIKAIIERRGEMQSAVIGASTKGTGFQYGIRGGQASAANQGALRSMGTSIGNWLGGTDEVFSRGQYTDAFGGGSAKMINELASNTLKSEAGRIIQSQDIATMGADNITQLHNPPCSISRAGFTYGELFGFGRFIDREGQSCHLNGNPITNSFNVFGGNASVTSYAGKTWYQFIDCDVTGTMPVDFKNAIQLMFCGGCYLMG